MNTLRPEFQEAFVKHCFDQGLSEDTTAELFYTAHLLDCLENDKNFREGFEYGTKEASMGNAMQFITPEQKGGFTGGTLGSIAGGIGGAMLGGKGRMLGGLGRLGGSVLGGSAGGLLGSGVGQGWMDPATRTAIGGAGGIGAGVLAGAKFTPGPWWAKGIGAMAGGLLGGAAGAGGSYVAGPAGHGMPNGPSASGPFIPDYMRAATGSGSTSGVSSSGVSGKMSNPYTMPSEVTGAAAGTGSTVSGPPAAITATASELQGVQSSLDAAKTEQANALKTPGLQGSVAANGIAARIAELEKHKQQMLADSNGMISRMRTDQGNSLESLDNALSSTDSALAARQVPAQNMDSWFRSAPQQGFGKMFYNLFNRVTGAQDQAQRMNSEQQSLGTARQGFQADRDRVQGMLEPIYGSN